MMKDDVCPIFDVTTYFNRKWILCILMDMFRGKTRFKEFKQSNPTISNYILSQTLKDMEEKDLIRKLRLDNTSQYQLTNKGLKVNRILYEMTVFSLSELECSKLNEKRKNLLFEEYKKALCDDFHEKQNK